MRHVTACAAALMMLAQGARAESPAPFSWTGLYIGAGLGAGTVTQTQTVADTIGPLFSNTSSATGYFGAVTAGYDYRVMQRVVAGAFVDFELSRVSNDNFWTTFLPFEQRRTWSIGARLGYLATPSTLWYALAGFTRATFDYELIGSKDVNGFFAGGGVESQLGANWSLRGEYRFTRFRDEKLIDFCGCAWLEGDTSSHTGRLLLIYRFGSAAVVP